MKKVAINYLTRLPGVPSRDQIVPGMAHFAGTGPRGKLCWDCKNFMRGRGREAAPCAKHLQLTTQDRQKAMKLKVGSNTAACRHFEER